VKKYWFLLEEKFTPTGSSSFDGLFNIIEIRAEFGIRFM
jgi:hypothetical protein